MREAKTGRMTTAEIALEKEYRRQERLGILCGTDKPTREQQAGERDLRRDLAPSALLEDHAICHATRSARAGR